MAHMTWVWSYGYPYDGTIHHLFQTHMQENTTSSLEYDGLLRLKSSHLPYTEGPPISIASSILQISLVILIRLNTTAVRTYLVPYLVAY